MSNKFPSLPSGCAVSLRNVSKSYPDGDTGKPRAVFKNVSFDFPEKGSVCVSGPSGIGKTTLLKVISGIIKPDAGEVVKAPETRFSYVFQEPRLFPWYTLYENVMCTVPKEKKEEAIPRAKDLIEKFGLSGSEKLYPEELSGGMAKRAGVIRALLYGGDVLICDEPYASLDDALASKAEEAFFSFSREHLLILVTHDRSRAEKCGMALDLSGYAL